MTNINILWSGGWDGTFRLLQLAEKPVSIYPTYIIDHNRRSVNEEKKAMSEICQIISADKRFQATIHEIQFIEKDWIFENCKNEEISKAFHQLREGFKIGSQYEWFALYANHTGLMYESAVVHQYHGKVEDAINSEGQFVSQMDTVLGERYFVTGKDGHNAVALVFGKLILPSIRITKEDEKRIAEEKNWLDIMKLSWFCHTPVNGEPCGLCGPCDDAMNTGMEWRMPPAAQWRYRHRKIIKLGRTVARKLKINI